MSLEKKTVIEAVEVFANLLVHVRAETGIFENGKQISNASTRRAIYPGDDYSQEDLLVQAICAAVHTPEGIAIYQTAQEAAQIKNEV
jgi:hypothetical protein